ncbi:Tat pathway signal sequence [Colletotrichum higginsianum IMI 349063]|uniref:Tat pathway signal sequence n=2 Tax=Colletotrichum higginsianum (strain IMI 349063) TaxID=759273 RepID=A0A1B7Y8X5_COLHI|nr:Tat pathway signal sequence [Colletotrichum higginsianum IMI 349063]OBR08531.1 Tat pathway signal sequence [Colletotrichum higginsianum IMI 349063]
MMMWSNGRRSKSLIAYTQVEDETNADAPKKEDFTFSQPTELSGPWGSKVPARFYYLLVLQSFVIVVLLLYITIKQRPGDAACARQLSPYSPYLESGDLEYEEFTDQNHLMQPSPYRGQPNPEVEEAWIRLWRVPPIHFPEDKLEALNKTPAENYEHVSKHLGGGVKGFLNVFHQLHCLNFVRQYTYRDAYDYSNVTTFRASKEIVRGHVDHCIETLRHFLMCQSDVTPVVFEKDPSRPSGSKSDFNMRRKCRNFGKIQAWTVANKGV